MKENKKRVETISPQQHALKELADYGLRFALLRQPKAWGATGDIDIIVADIVEINKTLQQLNYIQINQSNAHIKYDSISRQWIHLDVQSTISFGTIEVPDKFIERLLDSSHLSCDGIPLLNSVDEAILLFFHAVLDKGWLDPKYCEGAFNVDMNSILGYSDYYSFLPEPLSYYWEFVMAIQEERISVQQAIDTIRGSFILCHAKRYIFRRICQRIKSFLAGPRAIVFLGPDGSGKSTITEALARLRWPPIRLQYMGPARESEMRQVFITPSKIFSMISNLYPKKNIMGMIARGGWQMLCYFDGLDRVWRHIWFLGSSGVVLCDRYACDTYFRRPKRWSEILFIGMFPRPRFVFLCVGDMDVIHQRKPELLPDEIKDTIDLYRAKLVQYDIPYMEINTTKSRPEECLTQVVKHLINHNWFRCKL